MQNDPLQACIELLILLVWSHRWLLTPDTHLGLLINLANPFELKHFLLDCGEVNFESAGLLAIDQPFEVLLHISVSFLALSCLAKIL